MDLQDVIGKIISLRADKGWSQRDLAIRSGVSNSTISRIEKGDIREIRFSILQKIAGALGYNL